MTSNTENNSLLLNPEEDREKFKARIIETLRARYPNADESSIEQMAHNKYEDLLDNAYISQHIPTLVEGEVSSELADSDEDVSKD